MCTSTIPPVSFALLIKWGLQGGGRMHIKQKIEIFRNFFGNPMKMTGFGKMENINTENGKQASPPDRLTELRAIFENVDENKRRLAEPLLFEAAFLEEQLRELRTMPMIRVNPENRSQQKRTEAAKQYKENIQSYTGIIKVLNSILQKNLIEETDEFDEFIENFG